MAEFKIALGAVADVATSQEVKDAISGLQGHLDRKMFGNDAIKPLRRPLAAAMTVVLPGAGSVTLNLGRPSMGRIWSVNSLTILGADDGTAVAGLTAAVYIGDAAAPLLTQCIIPQRSIPYFDSFGYPDYWVHDQQQLFINLVSTGAVASQVVAANAWVTEFDDRASEMQNI